MSDHSIAARLNALREEIVNHATRCGRRSEEITLIAVSKYATIPLIQEAYEAGQRDFGEHRLQEALQKVAQLPPSIHWHWIGNIQSNKVAKILSHFTLIHSVDKLSLAQEISQKGGMQGVKASILLQVNTSLEPSKQGFTVEECREALAEIASLEYIELEGLMTMAPLTEDDAMIRRCFAQLRQLRDELKQQLQGGRHSLKHLSMGMSHDYPIAIEEGATLLRIGSKIFQ